MPFSTCPWPWFSRWQMGIRHFQRRCSNCGMPVPPSTLVPTLYSLNIKWKFFVLLGFWMKVTLMLCSVKFFCFFCPSVIVCTVLFADIWYLITCVCVRVCVCEMPFRYFQVENGICIKYFYFYFIYILPSSLMGTWNIFHHSPLLHFIFATTL